MLRSPARPATGTILVPFSPEAPLSGVNTADPARRAAVVPARPCGLPDDFAVPGGRLLLHFGAVDQTCTVWLDGVEVGAHHGGYLPLRADVTDALRGGRRRSSYWRCRTCPTTAARRRQAAAARAAASGTPPSPGYGRRSGWRRCRATYVAATDPHAAASTQRDVVGEVTVHEREAPANPVQRRSASSTDGRSVGSAQVTPGFPRSGRPRRRASVDPRRPAPVRRGGRASTATG